MRILIFGDSITYGAWDRQGGWADRLKREAHSWTIEARGSKKYQAVNLGIGGDTSTNILDRLNGEFDAWYSSSWPSILIFAYGINDSRTHNGKDEVSLSVFKSNTLKIIEQAKQYTDKIIFVGLTPIPKNELIFKIYKYSKDKIDEYDNCLKSIAESQSIKFIPIREKFEKAGIDKLFSYDNLHPNDAGHKLIYEIVDQEIQEYLT